MEITPKFKFVEGSFDTLTDKMLCIASDNHGTVELCLKEEGCCWNIPIGEIKLYDSDLYIDFKATMGDAKKLGDEIARRWVRFRYDGSSASRRIAEGTEQGEERRNKPWIKLKRYVCEAVCVSR